MFKVIVVGTDGSPSAGVVLRTAVELARLAGATLHVVHAHKVGTAATDVDAQVRADSGRVCADAVAIAARDGVDAFPHSAPGDAADVLVAVAREFDADVVVVGNRGMTGARRLLGSVPNKVSHHMPCSLLIVDSAATG